MSIADWKLIQEWAGAKADGVPGPMTAAAIIAKAGIERRPVAAAEPRAFVTGIGRGIRRIFIHCSATRAGQDVDAATIRRWHLGQGWSDIGYHFVIRLDGSIEHGRPENVIGSHAAGFNTRSIALVYVGGLDAQGRPADTRTPRQLAAMEHLVRELTQAYPFAEVLGHRDISPDRDGNGVIGPHEWLKACPCFDVRRWWASVNPPAAARSAP